jgi:hypothetical protein
LGTTGPGEKPNTKLRSERARNVSAAELRLHDQTEMERIEHWRAEALERAGFDSRSAGALAMRHDVDLHDAIDLLERGCPPDLALQILL